MLINKPNLNPHEQAFRALKYLLSAIKKCRLGGNNKYIFSCSIASTICFATYLWSKIGRKDGLLTKGRISVLLHDKEHQFLINFRMKTVLTYFVWHPLNIFVFIR